MRIREIELDNFKSFGKRTVVQLLPGFTTISGPNGSGKSNIIDSLLFALGLSSTRSMRAERLPDLLNNLSGKNEAKVIVRFISESNEEIEVSRRIRIKDNGYTSTYTLNGKITTLTEIHEELMRYNVSPTGFNVIMQGDVTGIITMSPSERRKIIDELAGVAEFDRRIEQANQELALVGEKIEHQKIVLVEINARLEALQADRDQALKYLELKRQKESAERHLVFVKAKETQFNITAENEVINDLNKRELVLKNDLEQAELGLLELKSQMGRLDQEIREKGGNEQLLLRQELDNLRGELTRQQNQMSNLEGVIGEKSKLKSNINSQIKTINHHLSQISKQQKQLQQEFSSINLSLMEKQGALSAVSAEIEVHRQRRDRSLENSTVVHEQLQKLRDEKHARQVRLAELATLKQALERELIKIRESATSSITRLASLKSATQNLKQHHDDAQALIAGIERTIRQLEGELDSTQQEIEDKREELDSINQRLVKLEARHEVAGESGYGHAVEAILAANIAGVLGTIGQLGQVKDKYQRALEVCIGPRLAHIVVVDDALAQRCIEYLKQNQAGRATFVPLNKIVTQPPGLMPSRPGVIDFAYNLVDFSPSHTKVFQYACGQTLVVDSIENARRLINQSRMVTLDGELFEKSGSITGGNENKTRMHFSNQSANDLNLLKIKSKTLSETIQTLKESVKELTASLTDERHKLSEAHTKLTRIQSELESQQKEFTSRDEEVESIKPRLKQGGDEIEKLDQEATALDHELKDLEKEIQSLQNELSGLTGGGKGSALQNLILESEELSTSIENIEKSLSNIQRQVDSQEVENRLEETNKQGLVQQLEVVEAEVIELLNKRPEHTARINELQSAIEAREKKVGELSEELQKLRDLKEELHGQVTGIEVKKTKVHQEIIHTEQDKETHKGQLATLEDELKILQEQINELMTENYEPPSAQTVEQLITQVERLEKRMRSLEPVNMKALEEYHQTEERQRVMDENLKTLDTEKEEIAQRIAGYDELKQRTFMESFNSINNNFQEIFAELSYGHGKLELEDPENPFNGGLIIRAQPHDKKMQRIEALSGGEKSLTALSFVLAFQRYAPAPFYAFDEVDMMLDGSNADRLARLVRHHSRGAQFVVVSLRRPMIENADHAIGVSLRADGYSQVVGIKEVQPVEAVAARA